MPTTLTPKTPGSLDERVQDHREALIELMTDAGRCEDISSGLIGDLEDPIGDVLSDRRLKCDIVAMDWSR